MGVTATAAALLAYYFIAGDSSGSEEPVLSHDDTVEAMMKVLEGLRTIAVQHVRAAENIKEQLVQQGQDMSREEIMTTIILPHFKNAFSGMQAQVLAEFDVDEEELEECVTHYLEVAVGDGSKLQEVVTKISALCAQFTGETSTGAGKGGGSSGGAMSGAQELPLDKLFEVLRVFAEKTKEYFGRFAEEFVQQHGVPSSPGEITRFAEELTLVSDRAQEETLDDFGLEKTVFEMSIMRNQQSAELMQLLQQMQMENNYALIKNGIDTSKFQ